MTLWASDFAVNSTADAVDTLPGNGVCASSLGACTLRAAIQEANALGGTHTITVPAGTYLLTLPDPNTGDENLSATGDLDINVSLSLAGAGTGTVIDGGGSAVTDRVFHIGASNTAVEVTVSDMMIRNGRKGGIKNDASLTLSGVRITDNGQDATNGGGLFNNEGTLTMTDCEVDTNAASNHGGGIYNLLGKMTLSQSILHDNTVTKNGGGIFSDTTDDTLVLEALTLDSNTAQKGGGIYVNVALGSSLRLTRSTVSNNTALIGGGLYNDTGGGSLAVVNSTISGNAATQFGGGMAFPNDPSTTVNLSSLTLSDNTADSDNNGVGDGGGFWNNGQTLTMTNSLVADNTDLSGTAPDCAGSATSDGYNLLGDATGCVWTGGSGDLLEPGITGSALLSGLADNGGDTQTHALPQNSPALDAANPLGCVDDLDNLLSADQIGQSRYGRCDIGAYEFPGICGDNYLQTSAGEACDGTSLAGQSCTTKGFFTGTLACNASCQFDTSDCTNCGNGVTDAGEACDDGNQTDDGNGCSTTCQNNTIHGDGKVQSLYETCDDGNTVTETCLYGQLACQVCNADGQLVAGTVSYCGDGTVQASQGEACDGGEDCDAFCHVIVPEPPAETPEEPVASSDAGLPEVTGSDDTASPEEETGTPAGTEGSDDNSGDSEDASHEEAGQEGTPAGGIQGNGQGGGCSLVMDM